MQRIPYSAEVRRGINLAAIRRACGMRLKYAVEDAIHVLSARSCALASRGFECQRPHPGLAGLNLLLIGKLACVDASAMMK